MADPIQFPFDAKKATQVAARLVEKRGGQFEYIHVLKMLYAIDRVALAKWGQPVIGGQYSSLPKGPVISEALNLMRGKSSNAAWTKHLQTTGHKLHLRSVAGTDELSRAEVDLVDTVFQMLGHRNRWDIVREMHDTFSEWENPGRSSKPIAVESILEAVGTSQEDIQAIARESAHLNRLDSALGR